MHSIGFTRFRVSTYWRSPKFRTRPWLQQPRIIHRRWTGIRRLVAQGATPDPDQMKKIQETMNSAMKNPQMRERMNQMQEALKNPQVRRQLEDTMKYMQTAETQKRIQELKEDPKFKAKFEEIRKGGIGAVMKAMNDVEFLEAVGKRVGAPPDAVQSSSPVQEDQSPNQEESDLLKTGNLLDAVKQGDIDTVEDLLANGQNPNVVDGFDRSPLHFAVSIQHLEIVDLLISSGANIDHGDTTKNTSLHYAAGYGRVEALRRLLEAGGDGSVKNASGKTPADVARLSDQNPILQEEDLMKKLDELAKPLIPIDQSQ